MECDSDAPANSSFKLLQPELMSVEELCEILRTCCLRSDLTSLNKDELIELFRRVALPLPQRVYSGRSWREKLLARNQKRKTSEGAKLIKRLGTSNGLNKKSLPSCGTSSGLSSKAVPATITSNTGRIKPPITSNNYTKKVLKLALKNSDCSDASPVSNKPATKFHDKTNINEITVKDEEKLLKSVISTDDQPVTNGKHKRIVIDFSDSSTKSTKTPKVVNLKRCTSRDEVANSSQKVRKIV